MVKNAKLVIAITAIQNSQIRLSDVKLKHHFCFQQQTSKKIMNSK